MPAWRRAENGVPSFTCDGKPQIITRERKQGVKRYECYMNVCIGGVWCYTGLFIGNVCVA
jgi:hypothetical protein